MTSHINLVRFFHQSNPSHCAVVGAGDTETGRPRKVSPCRFAVGSVPPRRARPARPAASVPPRAGGGCLGLARLARRGRVGMGWAEGEGDTCVDNSPSGGAWCCPARPQPLVVDQSRPRTHEPIH